MINDLLINPSLMASYCFLSFTSKRAVSPNPYLDNPVNGYACPTGTALHYDDVPINGLVRILLLIQILMLLGYFNGSERAVINHRWIISYFAVLGVIPSAYREEIKD